MSARMVGGSNIKAAEILVSPSTGRARKRILRVSLVGCLGPSLIA